MSLVNLTTSPPASASSSIFLGTAPKSDSCTGNLSHFKPKLNGFFFLNISFHPWKQYCSKLSLQDDHTKWQTWVPEWLLACDNIVDVNSTHFANKTFKIILLHRLFYVSELFLFKASVWWPIVMITMGHHTSALILIGSFFNCSKFNSLAALCKVSTSLPLANHCVYYCLLCFIPFF